MRLIKAGVLRSWRLLKEWKSLGDTEYIEWPSSPDAQMPDRIVFVSHRWTTSQHPDPTGVQLRELQLRLSALSEQNREFNHALVFYDYCSGHQTPRSQREEADFRCDIQALPMLCSTAAQVIILSEGFERYKDRAWCFLEMVLSERNVLLFSDQKHIAQALEFRTSLRAEPTQLGTNHIIDSFCFSYKVDHIEVEAIVAAFQHFSKCHVTTSG